MDYEKRLLIGDYVKTFNGEVVEGKFNGFRLYNKLNPQSVVGVIDTDERCYDVSVDSIELVENDDEKIIKEIISIVKSYRESCITEGNHRFDNCIAWLEKQSEHPSWSEEDEKMKSLIISTLTSMGTLNLERYHHMNLDEVKNWLQSITPNHWKPSKEQMEALDAKDMYNNKTEK